MLWQKSAADLDTAWSGAWKSARKRIHIDARAVVVHGRLPGLTRGSADLERAGLGRSTVQARAASTGTEIAAKKRNIEHAVTHGPGGRSSVSGLTVTVFGSTGFLGRYVVARYAKIGSQVIVPYRGDELDFRHLKVSGDLGQVVPSFYAIRDADRLRRLVESSDIVVNLVGRDYETSNFKFDDVHVTAAANVARACRETGVTRLVHVSAASASKDSPSRFLKSKALGEAAVRAEFPGATIVRPSWMFGHEDRLFNRIAFLHMMPTIPGDPVLHNGEAKYRPVFVSDVAEAIVRASRNSDTAGQTYELVGPKVWSYLDLLKYFGEVARRPIRPIPYPEVVLNTWARVCEILPPSPRVCREDLLRRANRTTSTTAGEGPFHQLHLDEVLEGKPGLEAFDVSPTKIESVAISFLRRYRSSAYYDAPADADSHEGQVALRAAAEGEEPRPHSA